MFDSQYSSLVFARASSVSTDLDIVISITSILDYLPRGDSVASDSIPTIIDGKLARNIFNSIK